MRMPLSHVEVKGDFIRYVLAPPSEGIISRYTEHGAGSRSSEGVLAAVGEVAIEAERGTMVGTLDCQVKIVSNGDPELHELLYYYSAPVDAVVPLAATYTLKEGRTFTENLFESTFTYNMSGSIDFANPISVPLPIVLRIIGPGRVSENESNQYCLASTIKFL